MKRMIMTKKIMSSSNKIKRLSTPSKRERRQKEKDHAEEKFNSSSKDATKVNAHTSKLNQQEKKIPGASSETVLTTQVEDSNGDIICRPESNIIQKRQILNSSVDEGDDDEIPSRLQSSFDRNVQGWEVTISQAGNVDPTTNGFERLRISENLILCGVSSVDDVDNDRHATPPQLVRDFLTNMDSETDCRVLTQSIEFKHTKSTPLQQSQMLDDNDDDILIMPGVNLMKRSSSTPSSFQPCHIGGSFGRQIPLDSQGASAFSQPPQRRTSSVGSGCDIFSSAFDPVWSLNIVGSPNRKGGTPVALPPPPKSPILPSHGSWQVDTGIGVGSSKSQANIASRVYRDVQMFRRRHFRSGRENPARPPSTSSSSRGADDDIIKKDCNDDSNAHIEGIQTSSSDEGPPSLPLTNNEDRTTGGRQRRTNGRHPHVELSLSVGSDEEHDHEGTISQSTHSQSINHGYQHLGSQDADDEAGGNPQSIESSSPIVPLPTLGENPTSISSPVYQNFDDGHDENPLLSPREAGRHYQCVSKTPSHSLSATVLELAIDAQDYNLSPSSHGSGSQSHTTIQSVLSNNTSSQTHTASTPGIMRSGQIVTSTTVASSATEADMEVMETNCRERLRQHHVVDTDGTVSIHSFSTSSTNPNSYLALPPSPASLRNGANLPVDRFFAGTRMPFTFSPGSNLSSLGLGSVAASNGTIPEQAAAYLNSKKPAAQGNATSGTGSPATVSSSSLAHTTSPNSIGEEPPRFVSYLERPPSSPAVAVRAGRFARLRMRANVKLEKEEEEESPLVECSSHDWEEATQSERTCDSPKSTQPGTKRETLKKKWIKLKLKPPRSPVKMESRRSGAPSTNSGRDDSNYGSRSPICTPPPQSVLISPFSNSANTPRSPLPILDSHRPFDLQRRGAARPRVRRSNVGGFSLKRSASVVSPSAVATDGILSAARSASVAPSPVPSEMAASSRDGADERTQDVLAMSSGVAYVTLEDQSDVNVTGLPFASNDKRGKGKPGGRGNTAIVTPEKE